MAERYNIQYTSISNDQYEIQIGKDSYSGESESVSGRAFYSSNNLEDFISPIKGKQLSLQLLATEIDDFQDLLDSEEREWEVHFYRNSELLFFGYITSENVIQDYYKRERYIEFEVLDPLAFLEDLSYVQDDGNSWVGNATLIQIIFRCLNRGFNSTSQKFNLVSFVPYDFRTYQVLAEDTLLDTSGDFLTEISLDQDQWVDDGEVESCLKILKDLLFSLQLQIFQINGNTWILSPYLYDVSSLSNTYIHYFDPTASEIASFLSNPFNEVDIETDDGSNKDSLLHCNENQQFYYKRALQELRVEYEFIFREQIIRNGIFENGVNGGAIPEWTIDFDYGESTDQGFLIIKRYNPSVDGPSTSTPVSVARAAVSNTIVSISDGSFLKLKGAFKTNILDNFTVFHFALRLYSPQTTPSQNPLILTGPTSNLSWTPESFVSPNFAYSSITFDAPETVDDIINFELELPKIPRDFGRIELTLYAINRSAAANFQTSHQIELLEIDLVASDNNNSGFAYTTKNLDQLSIKSEQEKAQFSTGRENINSSTFVSDNGIDPIYGIKNIFYNQNYRESVEDLAITLIKARKRRIIFQGDVYGFFDFHKYVKINDLTLNRFACIEYSFDTYNNVITMKLEEIVDGAINISQETEDIFKNVIDPTIKT